MDLRGLRLIDRPGVFSYMDLIFEHWELVIVFMIDPIEIEEITFTFFLKFC